MQLSMSQPGELLGLGVTDSAIEKWEKNQNRPTVPYRTRIIGFLGFDPETAKPTGGSYALPVGDLPSSGPWIVVPIRGFDSLNPLQPNQTPIK